MILKLYQKEDNYWYFQRLGKEYSLGLEISRSLSILDSIEKARVFHIKITYAASGLHSLAMFRCRSMYSTSIFGYVESTIFSLTNNKFRLPFIQYYSASRDWYSIVKIW